MVCCRFVLFDWPTQLAHCVGALIVRVEHLRVKFDFVDAEQV